MKMDPSTPKPDAIAGGRRNILSRPAANRNPRSTPLRKRRRGGEKSRSSARGSARRLNYSGVSQRNQSNRTTTIVARA